MPQGPMRFFISPLLALIFWDNNTMSSYVLFIDGENFLHKFGDVLKQEGIPKNKTDLALINLNKLFKDPLKGFDIKRKIFYVARLHIHPETDKKSGDLIKLQRKLRNSLVNQGYEFIIAGNVRAQKVDSKITLILPHPSPLNRKWFKDHPDFETTRLLEIREIIHKTLYN